MSTNDWINAGPSLDDVQQSESANGLRVQSVVHTRHGHDCCGVQVPLYETEKAFELLYPIVPFARQVQEEGNCIRATVLGEESRQHRGALAARLPIAQRRNGPKERLSDAANSHRSMPHLSEFEDG